MGSRGCRRDLHSSEIRRMFGGWGAEGHRACGLGASRVRTLLLVAILGMSGCSLTLVAGCAGSSRVATTSGIYALPASQTATVTCKIATAFSQVAGLMAPVAVYGPVYLPQGTVLADHWWPVLTSDSPQDYQGPLAENPRFAPAAAFGGKECQVLLKAGEGWLVFLENFRGDLGDTAGKRVGTIGSSAATLYEVNGGFVVQWSREGRWYAVFGRAMLASEVIRVAEGAVLVGLPGNQSP